MTGTWSFLGRGLLVLALSGLVACGDDDGREPETDAGPDGGGGTGGGGGGGGTGGGGDDAGITPMQCEEMAVQAPGPECLACVCEENPETTVACREGCWALVNCVATRCGGDGRNVTCITTMCSEEVMDSDAVEQAMAFTDAITACADMCEAQGGADSGTGDDGGT